MNNSKLIIALDNLSLKKSIDAIRGLENSVYVFKIGQEVITKGTARKIIDYAENRHVSIFYDAKFHDIPKTIELACKSLLDFPVISMITLHCLGGREMLLAARRVFDANLPRKKPLLLGVTLLTSSQEDKFTRNIFGNFNVSELVVKLAVLAKETGMDGVIASAHEVKSIKKECGQDFVVVTPGIRPTWAKLNDQKRVATPKQAIENGADYLVLGRPIFSSKYEPIEAVRRIISEI